MASMYFQDELDLDITHYELNDILNLFDVPLHLDESDMRRAKQKVLRAHPDKSRLDPKYFLFYKKAYEKLLHIYQFRKASNTTTTEYQNVEITTFDPSLKKEITKIPKKEFHRKFNELFDKYKQDDQEKSHGYEDWLKSNDDLPPETSGKMTMSEMDQYFRDKKREFSALTVYKEAEEMTSGFAGDNILKEKPSHYGCGDVFSKLPYDDIKRAYTETIIPVSLDEHTRRPAFKTVDEFRRHQADHMGPVLSEKESHALLMERRTKESELSAHTAFFLAKEQEEAEKRNRLFASSWKMLT